MATPQIDSIQSGQGDHHVQAVAGQAAARSIARYLLRPPAVHLGIGGVAQPQLNPGADLILQRGPDLRPARRRQHHVYAKRKPLDCKGGDRLLQPLELMSQAGPAIDDEEHVAEWVSVQHRPQLTVLCDRVDAVVAEDGLPRSHGRLQFCDHAPRPIAARPCRRLRPHVAMSRTEVSAPPPKSRQ